MKRIKLPQGDIDYPQRTYSGSADDYQFEHKRGQYVQLKTILELYGASFTHLGANTFTLPHKGGKMINRDGTMKVRQRTEFVAVAGELDNPKFVWQISYDDNGQPKNRIFVSGYEFRFQEFLNLCELKRVLLFV